MAGFGAGVVNVILGNWNDETLLANRQYDVVVADFLLGAVEQFWPYAQDAMLSRLLELVKPGGYLLLVGLEPYELLFSPTDMVRRFEALGDAAALLAGKGSYREMPQSWVMRQLDKADGFHVVSSKQFPSSLGRTYAESQLDFALKQAARIKEPKLREAFKSVAVSLRSESETFSVSSKNYAVVARRAEEASSRRNFR